MRHRYYLYLFVMGLFWLCPGRATAQQPVFDFNERCRVAYQEIIRLRFDEGRRLLQEEKRQFPANRIPYFLDNYIDFFTLFFNEDPQVYKVFGKAWEKRLSQMDEGPSSSPFFLFTKAILHFQRAAVEVKFGNNWNAGWEFRRSFLQIRESQEKFPDFAPANLYRGALQVAAGTIPDGYRWLSSLLGIKGTISQGMQQLRSFLASSDPYAVLYREEGQFYYCYLKFYIENDKEGVFRYLQQQQLDLRNNHLFAYLATNLSLNNQQSENAKKYLAERNMSAGYFQTPVWDLEMGFAKLNHLDTDAAPYFERFLSQFKGTFYVKEALQKLSWHYYLLGDQAKADALRRQILTRGRTDAEADKQSMKEAQSGIWPDPLLLRARLLSDGGYYREALRLLHGKKLTDFALEKDRLEFAYRVARLYDAVDRKEEAIAFYRDAIRLGEKRKEYFAARAAIHLGNIYEERGDKASAIQWFRSCLAMKDHDFKNSLDQRAKAGIARCKGQ